MTTLILSETQLELICECLIRAQGAYAALAVHAHNQNNIEQFKSLAGYCEALLIELRTQTDHTFSLRQKMTDAGFTPRPSGRYISDDE